MFYGHHDDESGGLATEAEADREWARNVGAERRDQAWILSDRDVWYANPAYSGPPVRHPEDDWEPEDADRIDAAARHIAAMPGATSAGLAAMLSRSDQKDWLAVTMEFNLTLSEWKSAVEGAIDLAAAFVA